MRAGDEAGEVENLDALKRGSHVHVLFVQWRRAAAECGVAGRCEMLFGV
jgi:hypothetical protein